MYETNLNLQTLINKNNQNQYNNIINKKNIQLMNNLSLGIEEGEFILIGTNSLSAIFNPIKPKPQFDYGGIGKRSATSIYTLVRKTKENKEDVEDVMLESLLSPFLNAIFPGMHLIEILNHGREAFEKLNGGVNKNITLQETRNINPVDAINPSKVFLPVTPFYAPEKPVPLLWERVRNEKMNKEEEKKRSKRTRIGFRSFRSF